MLRIPGSCQKSGRDQVYPLAPEFAEFLLQNPEADRRGRVFKLQAPSGRSSWAMRTDTVSAIVRRIGTAARVVVGERVRGEEVRAKYASAHDLRRSFGERWALRVMPQVLMELMRHESIETTQKYYLGRNAQRTADVLWGAVETLKRNDSVPSTNRGPAADNAKSTEPLATTALSKSGRQDLNLRPFDPQTLGNARLSLQA